MDTGIIHLELAGLQDGREIVDVTAAPGSAVFLVVDTGLMIYGTDYDLIENRIDIYTRIMFQNPVPDRQIRCPVPMNLHSLFYHLPNQGLRLIFHLFNPFPARFN
jgi:hypothetical protein